MRNGRRRKVFYWVPAVLLTLATGAAAYVFCPDDFQIMPMSPTAPWSAVGYINNGCTGVLVDPQHVLAAAHCFSFPQGAWQKPLTFFPNFHPDRPNPIGYSFDRFVVGTRTDLGEPAVVAYDWGIGHLSTKVPGFEPVPILPAPASSFTQISSAGYPRDLLYLAPETAPPGASCTLGDDELPKFCGSLDKQKVSRCWWTNGVIDPRCRIGKEAGGALSFDCRTLGGNSGSPLFWSRLEIRSLFPFLLRRQHYVTGVIHGYSQDPCTGCLPESSSDENAGASARAFLYAPRFASGVALSRFANGAHHTRVVAYDRDEKRLVARSRLGSVDDKFWFFGLSKSPPVPVRQVEAFNHVNRPIVLGIAEDGKLFAGLRVVATPTTPIPSFDYWMPVPLPSRTDGVVDVDALERSIGWTGELYALLHATGDAEPRGVPYKLTVKWPYWSLLPSFSWEPLLPTLRGSESYSRIAAVQGPQFLKQLFLVSSDGSSVRTMWRYLGDWSALLDLGGPARGGIRDIDATTMYAPFGARQTQLLVLDADGAAFTLERLESNPPDLWGGWRPFRVGLRAATKPYPPPPGDLVRITATRWQEDSDELRPVIFATDGFGDIYYTEQLRCGEDGPLCIAGTNGWRSFYN